MRFSGAGLSPDGDKACKGQATRKQDILVFQQNNSGEGKIRGIKEYGQGLFNIKILSVDAPFSPVLDDTTAYLPDRIHADLVLDYLRHPDLSYDLSHVCQANGIPVVASGKRHRAKGTFTPPT